MHRGETERRLENQKGRAYRGVAELKEFPAVERRRNDGTSSDREKGEVAVFQELGKALTSSLQLDQVLRTIMEKIDEFLRPDNWSLLLLDEENQEHGAGKKPPLGCGALQESTQLVQADLP